MTKFYMYKSPSYSWFQKTSSSSVASSGFQIGIVAQIFIFGLILSSLQLFLLQAALAGPLSVPGTIHFQGQIVDSNGAPLQAPSVSFTLQLMSAGGNCTLYKETQIFSMTNSNGVFDLNLGNGVPASGFTTAQFSKAFSNAVPFTGLDCGTYTPSAGDARKLQVAFFDGSQTVTLSTDYTITSVPFAMYADSLQGKQATDFLQANAATAAATQANIESIFDTVAHVTELQNLIAGTSTLYARSSPTSGTSLPVYAGSPASPVQGSVWYDSAANRLNYYDGSTTQSLGTGGGSVTSVAAGTGLSGGTITTSGTISMPAVGSAGTYTKITTDAEGRVSAGTTLTSTDIPNLDASKITTGTFSSSLIPSGTDSTKLPLSGGTMSGSIAMGGKDLTNAGYITIAGSHYLGLGSYTDAGETTLVGTLTPVYAGVTWYNSTSNQIKYWNGTAVVTTATGSTAISSINGLTSPSQTFANGVAGTAPAFNSGGSTHTLNIPMASGTGTTAGLVANTDYVTWNKSILKDGTVSFTADQSMGSHKLTNVSDPASAQDAATKNYSDTHVAGKNIISTMATDVSMSAGNGFLLTWDQSGNQWKALAPAPTTNGTVTSVGLALPSIFTVSNSPVTSSGTLTGTLATQIANSVLAGPNSGGAATPSFRTLNIVDLRSTISGPLFVAPNCTSAQTLSWSAITDNFNCQSIGSLPWSAISSGTPTTLAGYGITDAVQNAGGSPSIQTGLDTAKPASALAGGIFFASDTKTIYQYNSSSWVAIASISGSGGTITALTGDVAASGSGAVSATVQLVGTSSAANVHAAELLANTATSSNTASTIVRRDASGNFTAGVASLNQASVSSVVYKDSGSNSVTIQAPTTVGTSYTLKWPLNVGAANQILTTDATGNLSWTTPSAGTVTSVSVTGPITNSGTAAAPNIGITMSGDATIASGGVLTLKNTGTAGTFTKVTTDAQGRVSSATNIGSSDVTTALGFTPVNRAGDTMSGVLNMGSNDIVSSGNIGLSASKTLLLGTYTATSETTLTGSLTNTATDIGKTWYNTTSNQIKYWNGSAAVTLAASGAGLQSLNGLTGSTQTFSTGSLGTAPAFTSSGTTHTLNVPMASTVGTTAGLLSNADFAQTIRKDGTVAFSADESMGSHKLTNLTDPTSSQDAATKNYADINVAGKAVATSIATTVTNAAGNGFVLTWNQAANNWTAVAPATSGTVTSIDVAMPSIFTMSGGPVTSSGTITAALNTQAVNTVFAGPASGGVAAPAFRGLAATDIPNLDTGKLTSGTMPVARGGTGLTSYSANSLVMANGTGTALGSATCSLGQVLEWNGTTWACTAAAVGSVTSVTGSAPISVATGTSTPVVSIATANTTTTGAISSTDWNTFNGKLSPSLISANVFIGNGSNVATGVAVSGDATLTNAGVLSLKATGTAGTYSKVTTDAQGRVTSATNIGSSDVTTALGYTPVNKAGDTMTGSLVMSGNNITGTGNIGMNSGKTFLLGSYDNTTEATLTAALTNTSADIGKTWYNTASNQIKYWNGTAATALGISGAGLTNLNGLTASTQTFATGTSGTAPAFVSSGSTHTLNIPLAATAATTAGLLSNADYTQIIRKDGTISFTADQSMGSHKLTTLTDPASPQDAATKNYCIHSI